MPLYGWLKSNLTDELTETFGSVEAFEDTYEFDLSHIFAGVVPYESDVVRNAQQNTTGDFEPADLLKLKMTDPTDIHAYEAVRLAVDHHKTQRGRFVYVQTPGVFEAHNGYFGIENQLAYLLMYPDELKRLYERLTEWVMEFASKCIESGVDMIHISDDWGAQNSMLFAPALWQELVFPHHKQVTDYVHSRGALVSLHSDGNVNQALDGIAELGYDVVHPYQESAGMDYDVYLEKYAGAFTVMGGIDIQRDLGFGDPERAISVIDRVLDTFHDRGLILCTTHFVQNHCTIDELVTVFDYIRTRLGAAS